MILHSCTHMRTVGVNGLKRHERTTTSVVTDIFQSFARSFPVDAGAIVRVRFGSTTAHRSVDTVKNRVQSATDIISK